MTENYVPASEITNDDKLWALLSWILGIPAIIILFMEDKKSRPFLKYNAVASLLTIVAISILVSIISAVTCGIGAVTAVAFIYPIYLGIKSYQGEWVKVPVVTDFVVKQGWATFPGA